MHSLCLRIATTSLGFRQDSPGVHVKDGVCQTSPSKSWVRPFDHVVVLPDFFRSRSGEIPIPFSQIIRRMMRFVSDDILLRHHFCGELDRI